MSDTALLKAVEVGGLIAALAAFVWWQMRDLKAARERTARERERPSGGAARAGANAENAADVAHDPSADSTTRTPHTAANPREGTP
jgi:hypothetical protein